MFRGSEYVIFVDIEPRYKEMSADFVTRKLETGTIHVVLALIVLIGCQPTAMPSWMIKAVDYILHVLWTSPCLLVHRQTFSTWC